MKKSAKIWLITAGALVLFGGTAFLGLMSALKWDFKKLSTVKYETNTYEISEDISDISILTDTADIVFARSDGDKCRVISFEEETAKNSVTAENGKLIIKTENKKSGLDYIGFYFEQPKITVYLPSTEYNSLRIKGSTGNVRISKDQAFKNVDINLSTGNVVFRSPVSESVRIKTSTGNIDVNQALLDTLELSTSTGTVTVSGVKCSGDIKIKASTDRVSLTDITCKSFESTGDTGDILLKNVIASEKLSIERSTGNVKFDGCDAAELDIETDTGDVTGNLLTEKVFITDTDTGEIDVPKSATGGKCEIETDTGNIKINTD